MKAHDALTTLVELGTEQDGLVTTARAREFGVTPVDLKRLTDTGHVTRLRRGVYALPSAPPGPLQELRAAWLEASGRDRSGAEPPDTVVSHVSAAAMHSLGDLIPQKHEFTSPRRRQTIHPDVTFHRSGLSPAECTMVNGLPVTTVARTLEDLAATTTDFDHFSAMVKDAFSAPGVSFGALLRTLDRCAPHFGLEDHSELMTEAFERAGTPPELEALEKVVRQAVQPIARRAAEHLAPLTAALKNSALTAQRWDRALAPTLVGLNSSLADERLQRSLQTLAADITAAEATAALDDQASEKETPR